MQEPIKKRNLLPKLKNLLKVLASLSHDVATLELSNNQDASSRVRKSLIDFKNKDLYDFQNEITNIRVDIKINKGKTVKRPKNPTMDIVSN